MTLTPGSLAELQSALARAHGERCPVTAWDISALSQIVAHVPEDMTVTVGAGIGFNSVQRSLLQHGQWIAVDPPRMSAVTVEQALSMNLSGPHRFGFGTLRDHLIGIKVVLADGRLIASGGRVVKNVAGFDLLKVFIGARGSLGVIVEATFKLLPRPEAESFVRFHFPTAREAAAAAWSIRESSTSPVVLDAFRIPSTEGVSVVAGFAGAREDVEWQVEQVCRGGIPSQVSAEYECPAVGGEPGFERPVSVLPSRLGEVLVSLGDRPFVARAGNGIVHAGFQDTELRTWNGHRASAPILQIARRLKAQLDPRQILPPVPDL